VSFCVTVPARSPTNRFNEKSYVRSSVMHGLLWVETVCIGRRLRHVLNVLVCVTPPTTVQRLTTNRSDADVCTNPISTHLLDFPSLDLCRLLVHINRCQPRDIISHATVSHRIAITIAIASRRTADCKVHNQQKRRAAAKVVHVRRSVRDGLKLSADL
jgi:hypothetical protein